MIFPIAQPKHKKHTNISIEAFDGKKFKGRLIRIADDGIVFDASHYNAPADLRPYYLRPDNDNYGIDLEYIKTITISRGRSIDSQTVAGALSGAMVSVVTGLSFFSNNPVFDSFGEWTSGAAVLFSVGTTAGFLMVCFIAEEKP